MKAKILLGLIVFLALFLRLYKLGEVPPSLYWDEASLGYNAYSISQTLRDEHGELLPVTRFIAFGDYKPPGYIYAAAASIKFLGLTEFAVRFPSALAGTLLVLLTYFLAVELGLPALLSAALVAISPWAVQFSRGAFEANLATLFSGLGVYLFLRAVRSQKSIFILLSSIFFVLAMYTFNSHRIFVPLMIVALVIIFRQEILAQKKKFLVFITALILLLLPLFGYTTTREARLRFDEVSWTKDLAPVELSNTRIAADGNTILSKIVHNRRIVYTLSFLKHYTDNFRFDFLFFTGDVNPRLSIQTIGEMYLLELPFLLAGIFYLVKRRDRASAILFSWALLAPIPAAFARETPHALRILNILPVPQIIVAFGIFNLLKNARKFLLIPVILLYLISCILYLGNYFHVYPVKYASFWQYGYKQVVEYVAVNQWRYDHVSVTGLYGRPYIYFLFYQKYSPEKFWQTKIADRDWFGFWSIYGFDKLVFGDQEGKAGKWLYVRGPGQAPKAAKLLTTIYDLENKPVFEVFEKKY